MTKAVPLVGTKVKVNLQTAEQTEAFTISFFQHYTITNCKGFFHAWNSRGVYFGTYDNIAQLKKDIIIRSTKNGNGY